jgi:hypothetical protein
VQIVRRQSGCVRFCSLGEDSRTPRRYHCQPDLALQKAGTAGAADADAIRRGVAPRFVSTRFGAAGYCQLGLDCPDEIARGADDESELGAFHDLFVPQRTDNLRARLEHSVPAGMDVGLIWAD